MGYVNGVVASQTSGITYVCQQIEHSYHHVICKLVEGSRVSWNRFIDRWRHESADAKFLKTLLRQNKLDWEKQGERFVSILLHANPYLREGHLLKQILKKMDHNQLISCINALFEKQFENGREDFDQVLRFIDNNSLTNALHFQVKEKIQEMADCFPDPAPIHQVSVESRIRKTFSVLINFFPQFLDTILKALSLTHAGKGPESVWDYQAMLSIYFKIFVIPHAIVTVLSAFLSAPAMIYIVTAVIILSSVFGICLYLQFRPCPTHIPRTRNLTYEAELGILDPVIGRETEIDMVAAYLGKKHDRIFTNLLLVGEPGVGKTELVKGVAQKYREKKIFYINAPELTSGFTTISDQLRSIFMDVKGHEDKVVFFIDELGDAIKNNPTVNISGFLKPFLGRDGIQVIAACTKQEYQDHILKDDALASRFNKIEMKQTNDEQTLKILSDRISCKGDSIRFESGITQKILEKTNALHQGQQPRLAIKVLDLAINHVNGFSLTHYIPETLQQEIESLAKLQKEYCDKLEKDPFVKSIQEMKGKIETLKQQTRNEITLAMKIRRLIKQHRFLMHNRDVLLKNLNGKGTDEKRLIFLQWILLPWMEKMIETKLQQLPKDIPLQVGEETIDKIINDFKS